MQVWIDARELRDDQLSDWTSRNLRARELLKVRVADSTQWAIVGIKSRGYFPLILLTGENPVTVVNVAPDPGDFERFPVVQFGREYRLLPEVNGKSEIGDTTLSKS